MLNKELLEFIKHLTKNDKKTLSQKALKAAEEVGELAKRVLPFDNAPGTLHRFIGKNQILEEVCDTMLTVLSIAYDLGSTDDEIEQMINNKSKKWADLQAREGKVKYPIPYEIHITVPIINLFPYDCISDFKNICTVLNVKPILLDLAIFSGSLKDLMTSSIHIGDNRSAYEEMKRISDGLKTAGWDVIREKIETIPWHPAAPSNEHQQPLMPPNCYFECHLNIITDTDRLADLDIIANKWKARKSKNIFKKLYNELISIMVTYRKYDGVYEDFKYNLEQLKNDLELNDFSLEKEIIEFSIYDTKVSHDAAWIMNE